MTLELAKFGNVQKGLKELLDNAYSMAQNMVARLDSPVLPDGTDIWQTWLDSRTMQLYGGVNEDKRHRFKVDHAFDLSAIVNAAVSSDGSVAITEQQYSQSGGTEFIIVPKRELVGAETDYAIRSDKYASVREQLIGGGFTKEALEAIGGFKLNTPLTPVEVSTSDGWLELAVGKNYASVKDYHDASDLLGRYITKAQERNCFRGGMGMGLYVSTSGGSYKARPWYVNGSDGVSDAGSGYGFFNGGRVLRVRVDKVAEGDTPQEPSTITAAYSHILTDPMKSAREMTPDIAAGVAEIVSMYLKNNANK